ncbi:MAG: aminotransferase DegT [Deltaproteobacteria bacterium]|nr:MAG: aminotransferase DegT [Deltaproteobacteria bacterium]
MEFIDLKRQYKAYSKEIKERIERVLDHGRFIMGPEIEELEEKLASYVGVRHAVTVASGTMALEIALRALDIGPGDEVITVPFTWISTAEVIYLVGARPVFVDIDPVTYNIDPARIEASITPRTKAIIPVSLFGQMPDLLQINRIAQEYNIAVIEDGAQSFGATQNGTRSCGASIIGCTSFFPAKPLGCYGDGGAIFTSDDKLANRVRAIRTHGGIRRHEHTLVGTNGRFDTIQAAVLLVKLAHFDDEIKKRAYLGARYSEMLRDCCIVPEIMSGNTHVYAQYTIRVKNREEVMEYLNKNGVPTAIYYPRCLHEQPVFSGLGYKWGDFPEAERASREVLSIPMHPFLEEEDQERIVSLLKEVVRE